MNERELLAAQFEQNRGHLRGVAYRMLGSLNEADDAIQEAWLRLNRSDADAIDNLGGWLTTVVARVCLDMLRSRKSRREDSLEEQAVAPLAGLSHNRDPESEVVMAESIGMALLVVLGTLAPAERITFVLHDLFDLPFDEIAPIVGRSPSAARQLASRARRRVRGAGTVSNAAVTGQREVVEAFLAALRASDVPALMKVLDPDLVVHADQAAAAAGTEREVRGAEGWARRAVAFTRGARFANLALVDGAVGLVVAPRGRLFRVLRFTLANGRIAAIDVTGDPEQMRQFHLAVLS